MRKPSITIRLGAAYDHVIIDGVTFDRRAMKPEENSKLRRVVRDCFTGLNKAGLWGKAPLPAPAPALRQAPHEWRRSSRQRPRHQEQRAAA